ncbi:asparagine synthase-related protein [Oxyplasma meridianum]|uniref:Asparagine synthase-related protein n=1 Tax=Oxyplasma meridianum TaxID=3073602 RepID=A0AAX4NH22_9ARCH
MENDSQKTVDGHVHQTMIDAIIESVRNTLSDLPSNNSALSYSGGLDSTIIMALSDFKLHPYTTGFSDSKDISASRKISKTLGFKAKEIILDYIDINSLFNEILEIDPAIQSGDLGYEAVLLSVLKHATEKYVVTGQGADEFFYGYQKYEREPDLTNAEDIEKLINITCPREKKMADSLGKITVLPYMKQDVTDIASLIPRHQHINGEERKLILRSVARRIGLPDEVVNLRKTAAQYGSGMQKIVKKKFRR